MIKTARHEQLPQFIGLGLILLALILLLANLGNDENPPGNGNGGGNGGLEIEDVDAPLFIATAGAGTEVVGPGEILDVSGSTAVTASQVISLTNTSDEIRHVNAMMELRIPIDNDFDVVLLRFSPGLGLTVNLPGSQGVGASANPGQAIPIQPGETIERPINLQIEGTNLSPEHNLFWLDLNEDPLIYRVELFEVAFPSAQSGDRLFRREYAPIEIKSDTLA